jgi:hypothetical protein
MERTAFEEDRRPDPRAIVDRKLLDIENRPPNARQSLHARFLPQGNGARLGAAPRCNDAAWTSEAVQS